MKGERIMRIYIYAVVIIVFVSSFVHAEGDIPGEWQQLFDGKTLDGWMIKCKPEDKDKKYWKVDEAAITAEAPKGCKRNYIWLVTEKEFGDFELKMKVQTYGTIEGNSGIQVRSRYDDKAGYLDGPQIDIHPPGPWRNGFIYDSTRKATKWLSPIVGKPSAAQPHHAPEGWNWSDADEDADAWNDVLIVCQGTKIRAVMNGVTVADYDSKGILDDKNHSKYNVGIKGHIALQIHSGRKPMLIRFKDIKVREL